MFTWNTTNFGKGDYTISTSANIVSGEVDTADNINVTDDFVTTVYSGHDVAVVSVEPSKTVVGQGYSIFINVIVDLGHTGNLSIVRLKINDAPN